VKTVPVSILGSAEQAPLALIVTGPDLDSVMAFANAR
jgi:HAE1 family hydrophobic/amphiphilic exporter-1